MQIRPSLFVQNASGFLLLAPRPPDLEAPAQAPDRMEVDRQHDQPQRNHPEAEDRQEPDQAAQNERNAEHDAPRARLRNADGEAADRNTFRFYRRLVLLTHSRNHAGRSNSRYARLTLLVSSPIFVPKVETMI